jgi:RNA-directed DNA polymerase
MQKDHDELFDKISEPQNLMAAYKRARKGVKNKSEANAFEARLEVNTFHLSDQLRNERFKFGSYQIMFVRDPKERKILVAPFRDRIVHQAMNHFMAPVFEKSFIYHSYACRVGKGNLKALAQLQAWLDGSPETYVLKMDIKKYFASVRRDVLWNIVQNKFQDRRLLALCERLIMDAPTDGHEFRGIPIGNLTSQTFANAYLDKLDHFVKDRLGVRHYLRYVDDFVCFGSKDELHDLRKLIVLFLRESLDLTVDPSKDKVLAARNGLPFLGFVLRPNRQARVRRASVKRFMTTVKKIRKDGMPEPDIATKVISWHSYARLANVTTLLRKTDTMKYVERIV